MSITSDKGNSLYSGSKEGVGCVYVSVHDTTLNPSTCINNAAKLLCVMSTSMGTNESACPFYLVGLDTYGGGNHSHNHVQNQLTLFSVFLLGNMYKLNVTYRCPGLSFLKISMRALDLLNIGLSVLALKSSFQVGYELLMGEVIGKASSMKLLRAAVK